MNADDEEIRRRERVWVQRGCPEREVRMVMRGQMIDTPAVVFTREWIEATRAEDGPCLLVLAGPKGVGKTVAAVFAMLTSKPPAPTGYSTWPSDRSPRFRHVSDVAELGVFGDAETKKIRNDLKQCETLVVDDVGVEYMTEQFLALWDSIVNARYGSPGHTIFTTNLTAEKFRDRYGDRVYDRIRGRGEWFDVDGESMRGRLR